MSYTLFKSPKANSHGCQAIRDIKKGEIIAQELFNIVHNSSSTYEKDYVWNNTIYPYIYNSAISISGLGHFCNHSFDNNVVPLFHNRQYSNRIPFQAIKDIKKGEEIFCNYGLNWWTNRNIAPVMTSNELPILKSLVKRT